MILLFNAANKAAFPALMDDMFRARHEVFVEHKGWEECRRADGREIDAFDRADSVYLLALGGQRVIAGIRLTGAAGPTLAETLLPELFEVPPPRGEDLLEMSRLFARPEAVLPGGSAPAVNQVMAAAFEFARAVGARGCLMIARFSLVQALLSWGVPVEPLGLPRRTRDGLLMAVMSQATPAAARDLRRAVGVAEPVLWWVDDPDSDPRALAQCLGLDPVDDAWRPPGDLTPLARSGVHPLRWAEGRAMRT